MRFSALSTFVGCLLLAGCGGPKAPPADLPPPLTEAEKVALVATLPSPYHEADLANGAAKFNQCRSCHTIDPGGRNLTGPNLYGVFGHPAAGKANFHYSEGLKSAGIVWDETHLDRWLSNPRTYVKGTKMSFSGIHKDSDRRDVIVFLMTETGYRPSAAP